MNSILDIARSVSEIGVLSFGLALIMITIQARCVGSSVSTAITESWADIGMATSSVVLLITYIVPDGVG